MSLCRCTVLNPPSSPCNSNCIYAPNMLVSDSVTACDLSGEIDITPIVTKCGTNPVNYSIVSYKNVANVTISSTQIDFVPVNNNYESGEITYRVACGILSAVGKIIIVYKNNCLAVSCASNEKCNKCTGDCDSLPGGLITGGSILGSTTGGLSVI